MPSGDGIALRKKSGERTSFSTPRGRSENKGPRDAAELVLSRSEKREIHTRDNKSPTASDLEGNSWSGMSSIRIIDRVRRVRRYPIFEEDARHVP